MSAARASVFPRAQNRSRPWTGIQQSEGDVRSEEVPMRRRLAFCLAFLAFCLAAPLASLADVGVGSGGGTPGTSQNFQLVGHNSLFGRGMNAAITIYGHYLYVGNR